MTRATLLVLASFLLTPAPGRDPALRAQDQSQLPRILAEVDTTLVTVGDPIALFISVDHPVGSRVVWPDSLDLGPFEVLEGRASGPVEGDGMARSTLSLRLAAYELGALEIPSVQVAVVSPQGDSILLATDRFGVRVESVGLDEGGDIRPLKGPMGIPVSLGRIVLSVLGLILVAVLVLAAYRRLARNRKKPEVRLPQAPARPPHEVALEALARLEASPLLERGEVKEYHIQVSDILREYVEGRFHVPALEMTTRDLTEGLAAAGVDAPIREGFRIFLERCDMVKFAKYRPDAGASGEVLAMGRSLVERTIPPAEPAAVAAGVVAAGEVAP